jgi:hypothetical protein
MTMETTTGKVVNWKGTVTADAPSDDGGMMSLEITFPLAFDKIQPNTPIGVEITITAEASSTSSQP